MTYITNYLTFLWRLRKKSLAIAYVWHEYTSTRIKKNCFFISDTSKNIFCLEKMYEIILQIVQRSSGKFPKMKSTALLCALWVDFEIIKMTVIAHEPPFKPKINYYTVYLIKHIIKQ